MFETLLVLYLLAALGVIGLVLIQQGKGADMGASFGAGASNTVFGATGSGNFLTRMTAIFATVFFCVSLALGNISSNKSETQSQFDGANLEQAYDELELPAEVNADEIPE